MYTLFPDVVLRKGRYVYSAPKTPAAKRFINNVRCGVSLFGLGMAVSFGSVQAQQVTVQQPVPFHNMDGSDVYLTFCAGCHGFEGIAAYPPAPSFALGERLHKSDDTLLQSVLSGKNGMPPWEDKLPVYMLRAAIEYLRTMNERRIAGLPPRTRPIPSTYYKFRPVGSTDGAAKLSGSER